VTRPLVLIAALQRTGSTLVSELLTELPRTFVFREPRVFSAHVDLKAADLERLGTIPGAELGMSAGRGAAADPVEAARWFAADVYRPLSRQLGQIGIKEIRYGARWREVLELLGELAPLRVVALGRDPRDIYLSIAERSRVRKMRLPGPFGPESVALDVEREFAAQRELIEATEALKVRYEDVCSDPRVRDEIRRFVDSPVTGGGAVGVFKQSNREVHGHRVTTRRVQRWRDEPDASLRAGAAETRARLPEYCRYWGFPES
jgi:hypothetical protein